MAAILATRRGAAVVVPPAIGKGLQVEAERAEPPLEHRLVRGALALVGELAGVAGVSGAADDQAQPAAKQADSLDANRFTVARKQPGGVDNLHEFQCTAVP